MDKILIPIHLGSHWCMAVIDMKKQQTDYYYSLSGRNDTCHKVSTIFFDYCEMMVVSLCCPVCIFYLFDNAKVLLRYLGDEWKDKHPKEPPRDFSMWKSITPSHIPHQHNGCDCGMFSSLAMMTLIHLLGVFSCMYGYFSSLSPETQFRFKQNDIPHIRRWMITKLLDLRIP